MNVPVCIPPHIYTPRIHKFISYSVGIPIFFLIMLCAVQFDNCMCLGNIKICDISTNHFLTLHRLR